MSRVEPLAPLRGSSQGPIALSTSRYTYSAVAPPIEPEDDGVVPPLVLKVRVSDRLEAEGRMAEPGDLHRLCSNGWIEQWL
jgi:hypothetical protein